MTKVKNSTADMVLPGGGTGTGVMGGGTKAEGIWTGAGMTGVCGIAQGVAYEEGGDGFLGQTGGQTGEQTGDTFALAGFGLAGSGCFGCTSGDYLV